MDEREVGDDQLTEEQAEEQAEASTDADVGGHSRFEEAERRADEAAGDDYPGGDDYEEPAPELGALHKDYVIPGVDSKEANPYRWHTGEKRDHGGEDAIEVIDVVKQFGRVRILNGLNLGLPDDQISMVLGPSGTGKSVLIKHIVGLLYPDSGDLLVHGESVPNMTDDELFEMRKKFGLLFQDGALFGSMNVYDNVAFPLPSTPTRARRRLARSSIAASARSGWPRRRPSSRTSSPAACASAPASRGRSFSTRRSSCSTIPTRASTRSARRSCAS